MIQVGNLGLSLVNDVRMGTEVLVRGVKSGFRGIKVPGRFFTGFGC